MDEDQTTNPASAPTWADFKPPVMTTPFANGASLNLPPTEPLADVPTQKSEDALAQGFQSPALPFIAEEVVPEIPAPEPSAVEVAAASSTQVPDITTEAVPTPPVEPLPAESPIPTPEPPPSAEIPPSPGLGNEVAPAADPAIAAAVTPEQVIPAILETPELPPGTDLVPIAPSSRASSKMSFLPWFAGGLVATIIAAGLGYLYYNNAQVAPAPTSSSSQDLSILTSSQGPDNWEKNYSTFLLASERGGLEFVVTDPPATPSASASAKPELAPVASTSASKVELSSLKITIAKVEVHLATQSIIATGTAPEATKSAAKNIDRWETLRLNDTNTVDLMKLRLQGGGLSSLGVTYLAAGHYTEVRLYLTSATATLADGTTLNLALPGQAGIVKIVKNFDVSATGTSKVVVDFDAPASVIKSGNDYRLAPVVARVLYNSKEI